MIRNDAHLPNWPDLSERLKRALETRETVVLAGEVFREPCPCGPGTIEYVSERGSRLFRTDERWSAVMRDGYWTQWWGSLEAVESELTKWRPLKRQAWWRRVWRWCCGG